MESIYTSYPTDVMSAEMFGSSDPDQIRARPGELGGVLIGVGVPTD